MTRQRVAVCRAACVIAAGLCLFACSSYDSESAPGPIPGTVGGDAAAGGTALFDALAPRHDARSPSEMDTGPAPEWHSCDPARAAGVVTLFEQGFLEVVAYAEGTKDSGPYDGYNVMFTYKIATQCVDHPNQRNCSGVCSTAAGRYQFLYTTWLELNLPNFMPDNQARGAMSLITDKRKAVIPKTRALTATEFANVLDKVSWEWASLPPGRYGQPVRTRTQCRTAYCNEVPCS